MLPILAAIVVAIIVLMFYMRSSYEAQPLQVQSTTDPSGLWALKRGLECSAGMNDRHDGYYSSNKIPSGICETNKWAKDVTAHKILSGVGGSIFERQAMAGL